MTSENYKDKRLYSIDDYETLALTRMHMFARNYFNAAANDEVSLKAQKPAYDAIKLKRKTFVDHSKW